MKYNKNIKWPYYFLLFAIHLQAMFYGIGQLIGIENMIALLFLSFIISCIMMYRSLKKNEESD